MKKSSLYIVLCVLMTRSALATCPYTDKELDACEHDYATQMQKYSQEVIEHSDSFKHLPSIVIDPNNAVVRAFSIGQCLQDESPKAQKFVISLMRSGQYRNAEEDPYNIHEDIQKLRALYTSASTYAGGVWNLLEAGEDPETIKRTCLVLLLNLRGKNDIIHKVKLQLAKSPAAQPRSSVSAPQPPKRDLLEERRKKSQTGALLQDIEARKKQLSKLESEEEGLQRAGRRGHPHASSQHFSKRAAYQLSGIMEDISSALFIILERSYEKGHRENPSCYPYRGSFKDIGQLTALHPEGAMVITETLRDKKEHMRKVRSVFSDVYGKVTLSFEDAANAIIQVEESLKGRYKTATHLRSVLRGAPCSYPDFQEFVRMVVYANIIRSGGEDFLASLIYAQGTACLSGLNGRMAFTIIQFLKEDLKQGEGRLSVLRTAASHPSVLNQTRLQKIQAEKERLEKIIAEREQELNALLSS